MKIYDILTEATFDLNNQVDFLYDMFFKDISESINNDEVPPRIKTGQAIMTTDLPSSDLIDKVNAINPCVIIANDSSAGNAYRPHEQKIFISIHMGAYNLIANNNSTLSDTESQLPSNRRLAFRREFSEARIKGSIHHELSHWIDDTLHGRHIRNVLDKANIKKTNAKARKVLNQNNPDVGLTNYELDAQIHSILQLKRQYGHRWNRMSFETMIRLNPSLELIYDAGKRDGWYDKWARKIRARMHREGLLGDKMST